jgi:hypothetical protein
VAASTHQVTAYVLPTTQTVSAVGLVILGATTSRFSAASATNGAARAVASREEKVTILANNITAM